MLTWILLLPVLGAAALMALPAGNVRLLRLTTLAVTLVVAGLGVLLFASFDPDVAGAQFESTTRWFELPSGTVASYHVGVDGISLLMVVLTAVLMPIVVISTPGHVRERVKEFLVWLLVMETGMLGVFLSLDLVLFYFFWEISLVPLYFILGIWGGERRLYATIKFFLYTLAGSLIMLIAAIALIYRAGSTDVQAVSEWAASQPLALQGWLFLGFALAFAIKVPVVPFHTWLADAHTEAPTSGSVLLAAILLKMGTYGLLRFGIAMFPGAAVAFAPAFMALGAIGIVYGAFLAMAQTDLKRLIACSSVSHLGYVVLGLFALNAAGLRGGVLQMLNHGLSTGMLFLLVGMIYERRHTRSLDQYGGLAASMPLFAFFFVVTVLSSIGLPGLNGFVGEWMILLGSFQTAPLLTSVAILGVIFGAVYLLMATRRMLFGPITREENRRLVDLQPREIAIALPLLASFVWIGLGPNTFLEPTVRSLDSVLERVDAARGVQVGQATPGETEERAR